MKNTNVISSFWPIRFCLLLIFFYVNLAYASEPAYRSEYVGQENRQIKSLSVDDIDQLSKGKGWGLAKAAELNGMPGPIHLLQMKDKINLSTGQQKTIEHLYDVMKNKAVPLGKQLIDQERKLNEAFASRQITEALLNKYLDDLAETRKQLRFVHLSAHLQTPEILTEAQILKYNQLRGYGVSDPCDNVPVGHDAKMWKQHNNCK